MVQTLASCYSEKRAFAYRDIIYTKKTSGAFAEALLFLKNVIFDDPAVWKNFSSVLFGAMNEKNGSFYFNATKNL